MFPNWLKICGRQYHRTWPRMRRRRFKVLVILIFFSFVCVFWTMNSTYLEITNTSAHCAPIDVVYTWVNGSDLNFLAQLRQYDKHFDPARFDDKNELKYSLRSLEQHAPWVLNEFIFSTMLQVRHVYIVANQIPHWLDLSYERVSVIPHELLSPQLDMLPTFSSAAIETFLHRIPKLSKRFLYLNDDIFLGTQLYPEDLYTDSEGVQIYQAWMVPDCADDCPWTYIGDGACDLHCNIAACQYDGGDCASTCHGDDCAITNGQSQQVEILPAQNVKNITSSTHLRPFPTFKRLRKSKKQSFRDYMRSRNLTTINELRRLVDKFNKELNAPLEAENVKEANQKIMKTTIPTQHYAPPTVQANQQKKYTKDIYSQSLIYTNMLLNRHYGFKARNVLAHVGFLLDRDIIEKMQAKFADEVLLTASHRFRSVDDLQFSFAYYSFLMNEKISLTVQEIFDQFDTDNSGTWSDRELRIFLTRMFPIVDWPAMHYFEEVISNCSKNVDFETQHIIYSTLAYERYEDSNLPTITRELVCKCPLLADAMVANLAIHPKYKYKTTAKRMAHSNFMMLTSNISEVTYELDKIRRNPRKFNCINDNLDPTQHEDNSLIRSLLEDFYISFFPKRSKFELPDNYRNRFTAWQDYRKFILRRRAALVLGYASTFLLFYFLLRYICLYKAKIVGRCVNRILRI